MSTVRRSMVSMLAAEKDGSNDVPPTFSAIRWARDATARGRTGGGVGARALAARSRLGSVVGKSWACTGATWTYRRTLTVRT
ncbi:hypothetical protein GCM10022420_004700 [Streptomyces iranensis]